MSLEKPFDPESCEFSQSILSLTTESPEDDIKKAFIDWNRNVLGPMLDDIINVLDAAYEPYSDMVITNERDSDLKRGIRNAARVLRINKTMYCELIESLAEFSSLSQFLTIMGLIEQVAPNDDWMDVSWGMKDAKIRHRYDNELWAAVKFRYEESRRLSQGFIDATYQDITLDKWHGWERNNAVKDLDNLSDDEEKNAKILYNYYNKVLHSLICEMFELDEGNVAKWHLVFGKISPHENVTPELGVQVESYLGLKDRIDAYLFELPAEASSLANYESVIREVYEYVDLLIPHLIRLQTGIGIEESSDTVRSGV